MEQLYDLSSCSPKPEWTSAVLTFCQTPESTLRQNDAEDLQNINDIRDALKLVSRALDEAEEVGLHVPGSGIEAFSSQCF